MRFLVLVTACLFVACSPMRQEELTKEAARVVVRPAVSQVLPGAPGDIATDCIIDNATPQELRALAAEAVTGATAATLEKVASIAARQGTLICIANGAAGLAR